jgi:hypothetical protein
MDDATVWRSARSENATAEADPFHTGIPPAFPKEPGNAGNENEQEPEETRPRLDRQPFTEAKRDNAGRVVFIEVCDQCEEHGQCIDTGSRVLCLNCAA